MEKLLELLDVFDREDKANMYLRGRRYLLRCLFLGHDWHTIAMGHMHTTDRCARCGHVKAHPAPRVP